MGFRERLVDTRIFIKDGGTSGSDEVVQREGGQFVNLVSPKNLDFDTMEGSVSGSIPPKGSDAGGGCLPTWLGPPQTALVDDVAIIGTANVDDDVEGEFLTNQAGATPAKVVEGKHCAAVVV